MTGLGVIAVGDSIINGGTIQRWTTPQSWAQTLAERADLPFTKYAQGGHASSDVVEHQLPRVTRTGYDVGAVTVGANDLLAGTDPDLFAANLTTILSRMGAVAQRVVVTNLPTSFVVDPARANALIARVADGCGAVLVDVSDMNSPLLLRPDRVHPTDVGLTEIGYRAAVALGYERGPEVPVKAGAGYRTGHAWSRLDHAARRRVRGLIKR